MTSLGAMLPELSVFPVFGQVAKGSENGFAGHLPNGISEEELASRIAAAHSLGMVKGSESARAEIVQEMDELRAEYKLEMEAARRNWVEEEGDQSIRLIDKALNDLESGIIQSLLQILLPFIGKLIPPAALGELEKTLEGALKEDFKGPLFLSGPPDLVEELKARLKPRDIEVVAETTAGMELKARSDSFSITTRIKDWIDGIHGAD